MWHSILTLAFREWVCIPLPIHNVFVDFNCVPFFKRLLASMIVEKKIACVHGVPNYDIRGDSQMKPEKLKDIYNIYIWNYRNCN